MKILLASDRYTESINGVGIMVLNLAECLRAAGHDVKVLTMSTTNKSYKQGDEYYISSFPALLYPGYRQTLIRYNSLTRELRDWHPDIVHAHTEGSAAGIVRRIARSIGAPLVMTSHTDYLKFVFHGHSKSKFARIMATPLAKFFYRGSVIITTPSKKAMNLLRSYKCKKKIIVIPNGIRLKRFEGEPTAEERAHIMEKYGIKDNGKLFVIVSRLSAEKNIEEILEYFPSVVAADNGAQLLIVGEGPDIGSLKETAFDKGLSDHVIFTGMIPQDKLRNYYKIGTAFLSASTFEIHSLTYLEALACGMPLICREDPCLEGVLEDGVNGYIYRSKEEFVNGCLSMLRDRNKRDELALNSLKRSKTFSDRAYAERTARLYEDILNGRY